MLRPVLRGHFCQLSVDLLVGFDLCCGPGEQGGLQLSSQSFAGSLGQPPTATPSRMGHCPRNGNRSEGSWEVLSPRQGLGKKPKWSQSLQPGWMGNTKLSLSCLIRPDVQIWRPLIPPLRSDKGTWTNLRGEEKAHGVPLDRWRKKLRPAAPSPPSSQGFKGIQEAWPGTSTTTEYPLPTGLLVLCLPNGV